MQTRDGIVETIGNTPLIKLERASAATRCTILGKAEFMNPGQSVKDRPARQMILEAEKRGEIKPGGLVVESTAGNTGIGLALVANARGYRTLIVIPETQSQEKKDMLRLCGAELVEVPAVPYSNPNNYQHIGRRLADELRKTEQNGVLFADQWNNLDNRKAHYLSTGPEIWQQTDGKVDAFICAIGTGGTLAGVSTYLRERNKDIVIGVADPRGAAMYNLFAHGEAKAVGRRLDHRRHRARSRHPHHRGHQGRQAVFDPRRGSGAAHLRPARARRAVHGRLDRDQSSPARSGSPRTWDRATPSSPFSRTMARAINRSCSIRQFLREKRLPVPKWLERTSKRAGPVRKGLISTFDCAAIRHGHRLPVSRRLLSRRNAAPPWSA